MGSIGQSLASAHLKMTVAAFAGSVIAKANRMHNVKILLNMESVYPYGGVILFESGAHMTAAIDPLSLVKVIVWPFPE